MRRDSLSLTVSLRPLPEGHTPYETDQVGSILGCTKCRFEQRLFVCNLRITCHVSSTKRCDFNLLTFYIFYMSVIYAEPYYKVIRLTVFHATTFYSCPGAKSPAFICFLCICTTYLISTPCHHQHHEAIATFRKLISRLLT